MKKTIKRRQLQNTPQLNGAQANIHPVLSRVYSHRGVTSLDQIDHRIRQLHNPDLKGVERAADILAQAVVDQQKILIVGDFDADGATSTALAMRCFAAFGHRQVDFLVPNRFEFGYGLTPEIVAVAATREPDVIVTVDNGISSIEGVAAANDLGIKVVITDHHLPGDQLPAADAIVNPNQPGCAFLSKHAAGVGVIFYVMAALRARLHEMGHFGEQAPPPLNAYLDLVALGTVADVVSLDQNNRVFVAQGLKRMQAGLACPGINALLQVAGKNTREVRAIDLGFIVGPRLNAAGRLDDMSIGIRCLLSDDEQEAFALARELDTLNRERRQIESGMQQEALAALAQIDEIEDCSGVCVYHPDWHQGVIGIVASRLKERLHKPVIVFANDKDGQLKGSGRSVPQVHLRDVLDDVATGNSDLLSKFGGHAMAAGLSLKAEDLERFQSAFDQAVVGRLAGASLQAVLETDGELASNDLTMTLAEVLAAAGPWGQGFPEPTFDGQFLLVQQKIVGEKHLKMVLACQDRPNFVVDAIAFNVDVEIWPNFECKLVNAVYKLDINEFRGRRSLQLLVDYVEPAVPIRNEASAENSQQASTQSPARSSLNTAPNPA